MEPFYHGFVDYPNKHAKVLNAIVTCVDNVNYLKGNRDLQTQVWDIYKSKS